MPRAKEFDEAQVLENALELFRKRGFNGTSFADLTTELDVSRQSLYDTYGNKETLFLTALKRYMDITIDCVRIHLEDPGPIRKVLGEIFDRLISANCANGSSGCLVTNTMVELAPELPAVRTLAVEHARRIEALFAARLAAAQSTGDLSPAKNPVVLASYFYHMILGISVAARSLDDNETLRHTAQQALTALD